MSWERNANGEIREPSDRDPQNLKNGIHALIERSGFEESFSVTSRPDWERLFEKRLAAREENLEDWLDSQNPNAGFLFEVGIIESQANQFTPNFELYKVEVDILDELSCLIEPLSDFHEPTTKTHFGPRTTHLLSRNRHHHAGSCSPQDLYLIALSVRCLRRKSLRVSKDWLTTEEHLTLAESDFHPEVRYFIVQDLTRERLLLCTDLEKTPFLNWVTDVNRLSRQQLESLLPRGSYKDFSELRAETVSAVVVTPPSASTSFQRVWASSSQ